jgi:hypothetical protein
MPTSIMDRELIETETGTYELQRVRTDRLCVWSPRSKCPVGTYERRAEAVAALNSIRMGAPLPGQSTEYATLLEVVETAEMLIECWSDTAGEVSLSERLREALLATECVEELRLIADLLGQAVRLETAGATE